ncbi:serpin family protein [Brachybacterium squillarum]|uniref:serpin family protein n=1 Tax=Brachybacterium squillarum TaxID=661979 RepID=UPI00222265E2|nr:serpin family protein [Brachybacterium squillarum]MCW1805896.1 serpin family protein [Brachybacterium squillarum]
MDAAPLPSARSSRSPFALARRRSVLGAGIVLPTLALGLAACGDEGSAAQPDLRAEVDREPAGPAGEVAAAVLPFTARLLAAADREAVNLVCSPLSAQIALTMAALGAAGTTREQMEQVLGGDAETLAAAANTLDQVLAAVGQEEREEDDPDAAEPALASLACATWAQEGFDVGQDYLDALARWFGSGVWTADFTADGPREQARTRINDWVQEETAGLVEELVPQGMLTEATRLVLVNTLHLKAAWPSPLTLEDGRFTLEGGEEVTTPMLHGDARGWYEDELCTATALPAAGDDLGLALVRPAGTAQELLVAWAEVADGAADPAAEGLGAVLAGIRDSSETVALTVPTIDLGWDGDLVPVLQELGMDAPFTDDADFTGITGEERLRITGVVQKAVITVDEEGMEAAAATAVSVGATSAPAEPKELVIDAPYVIVAFETSTGAPLVAGRVGDPRATR